MLNKNKTDYTIFAKRFDWLTNFFICEDNNRIYADYRVNTRCSLTTKCNGKFECSLNIKSKTVS